MAMLCRDNVLTPDNEGCASKLNPEVVPAQMFKPEDRLDGRLSFPPKSHIAPRKIGRSMKHGFMLAWVEVQTSRTGTTEKDSAEGYMERDIILTGMAVAGSLEGLYPQPIVFSAGVEGLVHDLVIIEETMTKDRNARGAFTRPC